MNSPKILLVLLLASASLVRAEPSANEPKEQSAEIRKVETGELSILAERSYQQEKAFIVGSYRLTAVGGNRAVARPLGSEQSARIVLQFSGSLPAEGSVVNFTEDSHFRITRVVRSGRSVLTIYVEEQP